MRENWDYNDSLFVGIHLHLPKYYYLDQIRFYSFIFLDIRTNCFLESMTSVDLGSLSKAISYLTGYKKVIPTWRQSFSTMAHRRWTWRIPWQSHRLGRPEQKIRHQKHWNTSSKSHTFSFINANRTDFETCKNYSP